MNKPLLGLIGFSLVLGQLAPAMAVQPTVINSGSDVRWSRLLDDPFEGKIVYDKNYTESWTFVSSWSRQAIRATLEIYHRELSGYRTVWKTRTFTDRRGNTHTEQYPDREPVYNTTTEKRTPKALMFAVNGQVYTYEDGAVPPDLAAALASAPAGNMTIRLVWPDGSMQDMAIGKRTVEAWKALFAAPAGATPAPVPSPQ